MSSVLRALKQSRSIYTVSYTHLDFEGGHCTLTDKKPQYHLSMSIGTFTTLLLGYKSAEKLLQMGKIQATYDAVAKLDDILYHEIPYAVSYTHLCAV